jgi:hypothetical protein
LTEKVNRFVYFTGTEILISRDKRRPTPKKSNRSERPRGKLINVIVAIVGAIFFFLIKSA